MFKNKKGFSGLVYAAISIVMLVVLITSIIMPTLKTANTTDWTSAELSIWNNLGIFVILGVLVAVVGMFVVKRL